MIPVARRSLPNLLVPIDFHDGVPTDPSLFALSEGRRAAHTAGVTVFAIVMTDRHLDDGIAARLGRAGADKVLACEGPGLGAPPLDMTHGPALYAAVERIPPLLVLFPAGGAGAQLGPGLASRLGGAFAAAADLEVGAAATPLADGVGACSCAAGGPTVRPIAASIRSSSSARSSPSCPPGARPPITAARRSRSR